jgi:hypothetical protein
MMLKATYMRKRGDMAADKEMKADKERGTTRWS